MRTLRFTGPFTDQEVREFVRLLRAIDDGNPQGVYTMQLNDPDAKIDAAERLLRESLPSLPHRATSFARASYSDDTLPWRKCDGCARPYRGPAVYCSLECAIADA